MWYKICLWFYLVIYSVIGWSHTNRLPRNILPNSYSLKIAPNLTNQSFTGDVTIFIKIDRPVKNITLNSRDLVINEITLDQAYKQTAFHLEAEEELMYIFHSNGKYIDPGEHILNIKYSGCLNCYNGFFSVRWRSNGTERFMLTTKFSPTNARSAFPCFDEPYFKSVFSLRLINPNSSWIALSNMEEIARFNSSVGFITDFRTTLPMSTYLLTWFFTDLSFEEVKYSGHNGIIPLRIFTEEDRKNDRIKILKITSKALKFFEEYTGIPYPLQKLDSVEVPFYRSRGMEHWGAITYQTNSITFDKDSLISPLLHFVEAVSLISHEVSHMWFGNLVTHGWYNDLWLTEGFARFMQYKAAYSIVGEPFMPKLYLNHKSLYLYQLHCGALSLETVSFPKDKRGVPMKFGQTTYDQGAAVLFMLEDIIGENILQRAVRKFLHQYQFKHGTTGNFINVLQEEVPKINIRNMMETFLFQKKLPVIHVSEDEIFYILSQQPFCSNSGESIFGDKWTLPIKYFTSSNYTQKLVWFDKDMSRVLIPKQKDDKWIKISHSNHGLFRSIYMEKNYDELLINFPEISRDEVGSQLEEIFMMSYNEMLPCRIPLLYIAQLRKIEDMDFITFTYASRSYSMFLRMMNFETDVKDILKTYFIHIFEDIYQNVTWIVNGNESIDKRLLRVAVLESFCMSNMKYIGCSKDVKEMNEIKFKIDTDIQYIYKYVLKSVEKSSNKSDTSNFPENSTSTLKLSAYEEVCSLWIKQNIPDLIGQVNNVF